VRLVGSCGELSFTRSLKLGGEKTKTLAFPVETYQVPVLLSYVLGPPGSGSSSTRFGSLSGSFYNQAKICDFLMTFYL
jgi:hypothetical protein